MKTCCQGLSRSVCESLFCQGFCKIYQGLCTSLYEGLWMMYFDFDDNVVFNEVNNLSSFYKDVFCCFNKVFV